MAAGGNAVTELDTAFDVIQSDLGEDWLHLALKLGLKYIAIQEILNKCGKDLMWLSRSALEKWRQLNGRNATLKGLLTALKRTGRQDLVDSVEEQLCLKGVSSLQLDMDKRQGGKTSSRDQDKKHKKSTKPTRTVRKVKARQGKSSSREPSSERLGVRRLDFALNAVQSQQFAKEMRLRCCYIKIKDSLKKRLVSDAQRLEKEAMDDLSQFYNSNKELSRAAIIKVFEQHEVLQGNLDIAMMWPSSIYVQIFPQTDECIRALNEYLESGQLVSDVQTEFEKIGFSGPLQGEVRSMEQLEEEVAEIVEEAMDVFVLSETCDQTGETDVSGHGHSTDTDVLEGNKTSTQTYEELRDTWRDALLRITAWTGDEDKVKTLLQAGVQVNTENSEGETPLWDAVKGGHANIVSLLLQKGANPASANTAGANPAGGTGKTLVQLAAESKRAELVIILAQAGADVNKTDDEGRTPLCMAAQSGHVEIVSILTQAGADLNKADGMGRTPLSVAAEKGHAEVVSILVQAGADLNKASLGETPLWKAAARGHAEVVSILIQAGADLNKADNEGTTPLYIAAWSGHAEVVRILTKAGADLNMACDWGRTPLWVAAQRGHAEIVSILTQAGADLNKADGMGRTPLGWAAELGHAEIVSILTQAGADLNKADGRGWTPLYMAAKRGHAEVVSILTQAGADLDKANMERQTPLWTAAHSGNMEVVEKLIEAGADVSEPDRTGMTPYQLAIEMGRNDIATVIQEGQAKKTLKKK